ncbi:rhamnosyl transferase [Terrarubrum flagellatum]|uniref:rhamnosyl transferase n=1 Tax=Terrirubrum flagellatum TaxID=2895980 RepID=UPI0031453CEE
MKSDVTAGAGAGAPDIVVVVHRPDFDALCRLLSALAPQARTLILFLNSPLAPAKRQRLLDAAAQPLVFLNDGSNIGLGAAYNRAIAYARTHGANTLVLFDQDSIAPSDLVGGLRATHMALRAGGARPAVVGPKPVSIDPARYKDPRIFPRPDISDVNGAVAVEFAISSGALIDLKAIETIGGFREDFFIDAIDVEWCFRAWSHGFSCWIDPLREMPPRLGEGAINIPFLGWRLTRQSPTRLYSYARNQIALMRLSHVPAAWKRRILPYLLIQAGAHLLASRGDPRIAAAFARGAIDGLRGRLGDPKQFLHADDLNKAASKFDLQPNASKLGAINMMSGEEVPIPAASKSGKMRTRNRDATPPPKLERAAAPHDSGLDALWSFSKATPSTEAQLHSR